MKQFDAQKYIQGFRGPRQNCSTGVKILDSKIKAVPQKISWVLWSSSRFLGVWLPATTRPQTGAIHKV